MKIDKNKERTIKKVRYIPVVNINDNSHLPIHCQVFMQIKQDILHQRIKPGTPLVSMLSLAQRLKINRETVRQAYESLLEERILERMPNSRILTVSVAFTKKYLNYLPVLGLVLPLCMEDIVRNKALSALEIVAGVMDTAFKLGFSTTVLPLPGGEDKNDNLHKWFDAMFSKLNGLVYLGETETGRHDKAFELLLSKVSLPQVFIGGNAFRSHLATVTVNSEGLKAAVQYLKGEGHRKIGVITYDIPRRKYFQLQTIDRAQQMREAIETVGMVKEDWVISSKDISNRIPDILKNSDPPTAFLCHNDATAIELIRFMNEIGIKIPEDVSIIGYDDSPKAAESNPPLTTIKYPTLQMGEAAVLIIAESVQKGIPANMLSRNLPTTLIVRQSTGPVRKEEYSHDIFQS